MNESVRGADTDEGSDPGESPLLPRLGPLPIRVYGAMLAATLVGQGVGMLVDALVFGRRVIWVPLAFSVGLEALAGARYGAARLGRALSRRECASVSAIYSGALAALSLPLAVWSFAALRYNGGSAFGVPSHVGTALGVVVAVWVVAGVARYALMALLSRRRR